ncbi:effector-associated domain 2-containing protein [Actinacidiphila sp. ITFR-21]|uniref:VMAP-C domain-containing protein n=1 Tax=Actinacidiphila sp. ITFR-21 TaxID=3075199 RepID=UPI0028897F38|nr:hypothetical protein [Streptomyces sp. ITFR-21]WNI16426.1 hypothetical protein RLT57_13480 [Streptomyces sp. ITFR-21]
MFSEVDDYGPSVMQRLVELMSAVHELDGPEERTTFIGVLRAGLPALGDIPRHSRARVETVAIVKACMEARGGLRALATALETFAPGSVAAHEIRELEQRAVLEVLTEAERREARVLLSRAGPLDAAALLYAASEGLLRVRDTRALTLGDAFGHLARVNARADGLLPVMALFEHTCAALSGTDTDPRVAENLRRWNDDLADRLAVKPPLKALRAEIAQTAVTPPAPACLVIQLSPHGTGGNRYHLSSWQQVYPGPWRPERGEEDLVVSRDGIDAAVARLVARAEERWGEQGGSPMLEFILPLALMNHPIEWAPADPGSASAPLCLTYPVALRSLERMRARKYHRQWRNRWLRLTGEHGITCHWDTSGRRDHDPDRWRNQLAGDEGLVSVALSSPPLAEADGGMAALRTALFAGVPLVVWDRRSPAPDESRRQLRRLMRGTPEDLRKGVRKIRCEAATTTAAKRGSHPGKYLAVLLDDPDRMVDGDVFEAEYAAGAGYRAEYESARDTRYGREDG